MKLIIQSPHPAEHVSKPRRVNLELHLDPWPIFTVNTRKRLIDPKPAYQRGPIWSINHQQLFIDSILRGYDIPKLYLRKLAEGGAYTWEVIDGQQRLRAIWDFMTDVFPLSDDSDPVEGHKLAGLSFSDLHYSLKDTFLAYTLSIVEVAKAEDQEVEDMFLRLQNGEFSRKTQRYIGNSPRFCARYCRLK
jgi:hypothetical protein